MEAGTTALKLEVYELHVRREALGNSDDLGVAEAAEWYDDLITRLRGHIAEREALPQEV